jgi:aminopeptidase YwaD
LTQAAGDHVAALCAAEPDRRPGSEGNRAAVASTAGAFERAGWEVDTPEFACTDWETEGGSLTVGGTAIDLVPSPYGLGVSAAGPIRLLTERPDPGRSDLAGSIVVLHGAAASEPLTPKAFPFYGSEEHTAVIDALEAAAPAAVIAVTGKYPALCGALDPFPLIEDGDFAIPTANLRPGDAGPVLGGEGAPAEVEIRSRRWLTTARNTIATRGPRRPRVTVIAHLDSKPGTPGAVDNAAGVAVLLMLAEILSPERRPHLDVGVELLAVNGEDHFAAPGEVHWLAANEDHLDDIVLAVNIDGAGYRGAGTAYSAYNLDGDQTARLEQAAAGRKSLVPGPPFFQSDHAIFAMRGRPAAAFTTEAFDEMLETLFHAPSDTPDRVDASLLLDIALAIADLIASLPGE